jgi:hypothetical protein
MFFLWLTCVTAWFQQSSTPAMHLPEMARPSEWDSTEEKNLGSIKKTNTAAEIHATTDRWGPELVM